MLYTSPSLLSGSQGQERPVRLFPDRGTLPKICEYARNRITLKRRTGNLTAWLYGCILF